MTSRTARGGRTAATAPARQRTRVIPSGIPKIAEVIPDPTGQPSSQTTVSVHLKWGVDWLSLRQRFDHPIPVFGDGVLSCTDSSGVLPHRTPRAKSVPTPGGSVVKVSSDGCELRFCGNPSRLFRRDNVWGLGLEEALECPGRCKSEPPCRPNSEPGMEAGSESSPAVDEFMLTA